jgi:hypothetical protein
MVRAEADPETKSSSLLTHRRKTRADTLRSAAYGQQTWWLYTCLTASRTIDLNKAGCELPKP